MKKSLPRHRKSSTIVIGDVGWSTVYYRLKRIKLITTTLEGDSIELAVDFCTIECLFLKPNWEWVKFHQ